MIRFLGLALLPFTAALFAAPAPPADENPDAEKLFKAMEEKILKAKTMECDFKGSLDRDNKRTTMEGSLHVAEGDKARLEMSGEEPDGKKHQMLTVSDGKKNAAIVDGKARPLTETPKNLNHKILGALGRGGAIMLTFLNRSPKAGGDDEKIEDLLKVSDFKLGKKEKVGDAETQAVEYTLQLKGEGEAFACVLYIDLKTQLPAKRVFTMKGIEKFTLTETYTKLILDGKIDPAKFELPK